MTAHSPLASSSYASKRYAERVSGFSNPAARALLETMERKKSNLAVSVDVTKKEDLLRVVETVGPDVCMVKTHIDIVEDFDTDLTDRLALLSKQHDFLIFEDRKFADIGNTVSLQYSAGVHKIASWSHITNAHLVPGPGIITGLADVGVPLGRGLLLLAEMSSKGNLAGGEYGRKCVEAARADETGFTCGFIAMDRIDERNPPTDGQASKDFLILTPGVGLDVKGDGKGQQYRTPDEVIKQSGCDVIIVGRGIYGPLLQTGSTSESFAQVKQQAARYKEAGWAAYLERTGQRTAA
ncbi:unnamed protein product [Parajaminaea phylloscopi]